MPELTPQSTPPPVATPPTIVPETWEEHPGFRETFLYHFTRPEDNACLRQLGRLLYELILETAGTMPYPPESATRTELRAALGDLRHVQGFLASVAQERKDASLSPGDEHLSALADAWAHQTGILAYQIEEELAGRA